METFVLHKKDDHNPICNIRGCKPLLISQMFMRTKPTPKTPETSSPFGTLHQM